MGHIKTHQPGDGYVSYMVGKPMPRRVSKHDELRASSARKLHIVWEPYHLYGTGETLRRPSAMFELILKSGGDLTTSPKSRLLNIPRLILLDYRQIVLHVERVLTYYWTSGAGRLSWGCLGVCLGGWGDDDHKKSHQRSERSTQ